MDNKLSNSPPTSEETRLLEASYQSDDIMVPDDGDGNGNTDRVMQMKPVLRRRNTSAYSDFKETCLSWSNVSVTSPGEDASCLPCLGKGRPSKQILHSVSGVIQPGRFLAIMGSSGSGKTTLLNVLTRRNLARLEVEGQVLTNGLDIGDDIADVSAYVQQQDILPGMLTTREHLWFHAKLRIGSDVPSDYTEQKITDVMTETSLAKCADTRIGIPGVVKGLSGGEMKRLAIATCCGDRLWTSESDVYKRQILTSKVYPRTVRANFLLHQLLTRPALLFLDEPTSGLDSFMAQSVIEALKDLASRGRTVIATIHQPSSHVYAMFDQVLLMGEGRTAYLGPADELMSFFSDLGYQCPMNYNPADFYVQTLAIAPGNEQECRNTQQRVVKAYEESTFSRSIKWQIESNNCKNEANKNILDNGDCQANPRRSLNAGSMLAYRLRHWLNIEATFGDCLVVWCQAGWFTQFAVVCWRSMCEVLRNKRIIGARLIYMALVGLVVGLIYLQQDIDQFGTSNINSVIFINCIQMVYVPGFAMATLFASENILFRREYDDRIYSPTAYYCGRILTDYPLVMTGAVIYGVISYWLIGMTPDADVFFVFLALLIILGCLAAALAHFVGALFPNAQQALSVLPFILALMLLFSGFLMKDGTFLVIFLPFQAISVFRYGYQAMIINQWRKIDFIECEYAQGLPANSTLRYHLASVCTHTGEQVLDTFSYKEDQLGTCFLYLCIILVVSELMGIISFYFRAKQKS